MIHDINQNAASRQYAAAYAAHYLRRDLPFAVQLYRRLVAKHPNSPEADFCHMQIQNVINAVVPKQELQDAQIALVLTHFEHDAVVDDNRTSATLCDMQSPT